MTHASVAATAPETAQDAPETPPVVAGPTADDLRPLRPVLRHAIAAVWFLHSQPSEEAPIECVCGDKMLVRDWPAHATRASKRGQRNTWGCHPMGLPGMPCQRCGRLLEMGEVNAHNFSVRVRHVE